MTFGEYQDSAHPAHPASIYPASCIYDLRCLATGEEKWDSQSYEG